MFTIDERNINIEPAPVYVQDNFPGLSHKQYFAAMALQGLLARNRDWPPEDASRLAMQYAEAMVKVFGIENDK